MIKNYFDVNTVAGDKRTILIPFYLRDLALVWLHTQPTTMADLNQLTYAVADRFNGSDGLDANMGCLTFTVRYKVKLQRFMNDRK